MLLEVKQVKKVFGKGLNRTEALSDMNLFVDKGEFVAIMGESGSGKTTLLQLIATFDQLTEGTIQIDGQSLASLKSKDIASFRREQLGFVFQDFNLLDSMTNKDNILMPLVLANKPVKVMQQRIDNLAQRLNISDILNQFPNQISGGQKQRVAIARALITQPQILLADEPTGALDSKSSKHLMQLFQQINQQQLQTILMVTHSNIDASYANRVIFIKDGRLYHEIYRGEERQSEYQKRIADSLAILNNGRE
ncbi:MULTISPECIES: ABC transporter ATP-binding protein [Staphylococcus]|uniref:Bacitracin transport system ATP-binding protein n=2 Tax=Staphylococcus TaxID=1279 RepID=A0ABY1H448_9STAP|nr:MULTISPECIES: ABC transporter ATP-binding protein [Staphylococcus]ATH61703.1 bacteriocin ABC transporter ATP-binding protein [Staphylococcus pasteuri]KKI55984.1 ABC transporter ATP-binding protein YvcR [Staphylococcus pasteuri]MBM6505991.1 ABC transporter ATP-binding protein [Staphylococcus pasteuri]MCD9066635.1 ABC transporter ATP-binding protein [Staphylococcus pasteuri]MCE3022032.1 ABC transporter ATP-binding protein [Staphylococcus pasteuri]